MFVTSTDMAIVVREVSSLLRMISPIPFRRLAVLKYRSISMRSDWSLAVIRLSFFKTLSSLLGRPALQYQGAEHHAAWLCNIPDLRGKHDCVERFPCTPWQLCCSPQPFIGRIQLHTAGSIEIDKAQLLILVIRGPVHAFCPQVQCGKPYFSVNRL